MESSPRVLSIRKKTKKNETTNLRPLSSRRRKPERDPDNPFNIPDTTQVFIQQDEIEEKRKEDIKKIQNMPLKKRTMLSQVPNSQRVIRERIENRFKVEPDHTFDGIRPVTESRQRQQHAAHMIQEQREIFLTNLLIDRHQKELERIKITRQTNESKLESLDMEMCEQQNRRRTYRSQLEMSAARSRQMLDEQIRKRQEIETTVKKKRIEVQAMKVELAKLEENYENFKEYESVLNHMEKMYGERPKTVTEFIEIFDRLENDGLFLIQGKRQIQGKSESANDSLELEIKLVKDDIKDLEEEIASLSKRKDAIAVAQQATVNSEELDKNLAYLQKIISRVFLKCFPEGGSAQNSVMMLSMIEMKIEELLKKLDGITDRDWIAQRIKTLHNERRAALRLANQKKKEQELDEKKRAMIARATKPVKRREGRPLNERIVPNKNRKKDMAKLEKEQSEKERLEKLLFGDSIFD